MPPRTVAVFCMPDRGHFQRLRALTSGLTRLGAVVHFFTHRRFQAEVEEAGGHFVDLFSKYSVDDADDESWPDPVRYVSFAGQYGDQIRADVEAVHPSLVIHDTFAVIGPVVAHQLAVPRVNVCSGHDVVPERFLAILRAHPRVRISARCVEAVAVLRTRYGMPAASPFSYVDGISPDLNIYGEPAEFLPPGDRPVFEPVAFYGSLPPFEQLDRPRRTPAYFGDESDGRLKVYIAFGTMIWRYRAAEAVAALTALTRALARRGRAQTVIGLGGAELESGVRAALTASDGVRVETYVDQWSILQEADLFVSQQGSNSTHEAIFHRVPMISYPFVWDQPGMAKTCARLGLAVPLVDTPMSAVTLDDVDAAIERVLQEGDAMRAALSTAREWELETIAGRPAVLRRILDLIV